MFMAETGPRRVKRRTLGSSPQVVKDKSPAAKQAQADKTRHIRPCPAGNPEPGEIIQTSATARNLFPQGLPAVFQAGV